MYCDRTTRGRTTLIATHLVGQRVGVEVVIEAVVVVVIVTAVVGPVLLAVVVVVRARAGIQRRLVTGGKYDILFFFLLYRKFYVS